MHGKKCAKVKRRQMEKVYVKYVTDKGLIITNKILKILKLQEKSPKAPNKYVQKINNLHKKIQKWALNLKKDVHLFS